MARYILIDNNSGFIFGDSADLSGEIFSGSALEFAKALDERLGLGFNRIYFEHFDNPRSTVSGYHVYRADINGSEAVTVIYDGQDQETIDAVVESCRFEGFIETKGDTGI